jgi:signal transduction histidine kinase
VQLFQVLTSIAFRYMLTYVVVLSIAVFISMAVLYAVFAYNYFEELQESIVEELQTLSIVYEGQGVAGIEEYIQDQQGHQSSFFYLLADADFNKVTGTLVAWPQYREFGDGWMSFGRQAAGLVGGVPTLELVARSESLSNGYHVLAALRYNDILESNQLVISTLLRTMIATLILGIVGGYFSARFTLQRIEDINSGISNIVKGDLGQRIPLGDSEGNVRQLIVNFNSMLDQTQSLMQGVRTVSDNIAHDLRTPLTRMRNHLSLLQNEVASDDMPRVQILVEECDEILATFNALLRIAQLEAGNRITSFAHFDMGALVTDVVDLYEPLAQDKELQLEQAVVAVEIDGDRDLLFQMMVNLIDNAVKYTPAGGSIWVSVKPLRSGGVLLSVADSGPGIPPADRENVFRRFFRLESSRGEHPGSGLGLSLVRAVVNMHHGRIELLDNLPGLRVEVSLGSSH